MRVLASESRRGGVRRSVASALTLALAFGGSVAIGGGSAAGAISGTPSVIPCFKQPKQSGIAVRFRNMGNAGADKLYVGRGDLGNSANRTAGGASWTWTRNTGTAVSFTLDTPNDRLIATLGANTVYYPSSSGGLAAALAAGGYASLSALNIAQITVSARDANTAVSLSSLKVDGMAIDADPNAPGVQDFTAVSTGPNYRDWMLTGLDFADPNGWTMTGTVTPSGTGTFSQEGGSVNIRVGSKVDPVVTISGPATVTEGVDATATYPVTVTGTQYSNIAVDYGTVDGTAKAPGDYTATSGTLNIDACTNPATTITVPIADDQIGEPTKSFSVALSNPVGATLGSPSSVTTAIKDNDLLLINAVPANKTYDAATAAPGTPTVDPSTPLPTGYALSGCVQMYASPNAGSQVIAASGCKVLNGSGADVSSAYDMVYSEASGTIAQAALTISAVADSKAYDGTTASPGVPTVSGLQGSDAVTGRAQVFDGANVGSHTLSVVPGYTVNDGNGGNNYAVTTRTASGSITEAATIINAASSNKTYNATTAAGGTPTVDPTTPLPVGYSLADCVQTYDSKNAGSRTITASACKVLDASANDVTSQFSLTYVTASGTINKASLTIAAVTDTKTYNKTTASSAVPTVTGLQTGDTVTGLAQVFSNANAGSRTLSVSAYTVNDGNGGNNYVTPTLVTAAGTINKAPLTVAAVTSTKTYNRTTASSGVPVATGLQGSDSITATQVFDSVNAGARTLSVVPGYTVNDGNGGNNYVTPTLLTAAGTINKAPLTIAAVTDTKFYDGTGNSNKIPTVTGLQGSDTVTATQTFDSANAGARTLAVATATVNDGNGGNNYAVTKTTASGTINKSVTALVAATPPSTKAGTAVTLSATLTNTSVNNMPIASTMLGLTVCSPSNICSIFYPTTNASGVASVSFTPSGETGNYSVKFSYPGNANLYAVNAAPVTLSVYGVNTSAVVSASGSQYRGGIVVTSTLRYQNGTSASPLSGQGVKYYLMPTSTETNVANGVLIGTATSDLSGVSSVLYRMDTLSPAPAVGTKLYFVATYAGTTAYGPSQSATATSPAIAKRGDSLSGTAVKSGTNVALNVTLRETDVVVQTSTAGVVTNTTITGVGIANQTLTFRWLNSSGSSIGSFTATTSSTGVVSTTKAIPTGAVKVRVVYATTPSYLAAPSLDLTL